MRYNWLFIIILLLPATGRMHAQLAIEDSLRQVLTQKKLPLAKRHDATVRLGQVVFFNKGWQEGLQIYRQSIAIARREKDGQYLARSYGMMAMSHYIMSDSVASKKYLDSAFYYIRRSHSKSMKAYMLYCKGWLESRAHQEVAAIKTFQQALDIYETLPDMLHRKQNIYEELAGVYYHWYDLVNVEKYTRLSLDAARQMKKMETLVEAYQGRGAYFINVYRSENANKKNLDSALYYMRRSLNLAQNNRGRLTTPSNIPFSAIGISHIFLEYFPRTPQYQDSINYYNKIALEEGKRTQQFAVEAGVYNAMASMAFESKNYDSAIQYFNAALATSAKDLLFDKFNLSETYLGLSAAYEGKGDMAMALHNYKQHVKLYKELFNIEKMNSAKRLEIQYETAKKEKVLLEVQYLAELKDKALIETRLQSGMKDRALLAAQYAATLKDKALLSEKYKTSLNIQALAAARVKEGKREQELKAMHQTVSYNKKLNKIYSILTLAGFLVALFLFYAYKQRSKALAQEKKLHKLEMDKVQQEHRISLLSAMLDGQEQERTRLARDLHDGLGGLLSGVKIELSGLTILTSEPQQTIVTKTLHHLDNAVDELRRIAKSMMPEVLLIYGLGEATKEYCSGLQKSGLPITCQIYNYKNDTSPGRQVTLYRLMQELVNNAVKHAGATQILVQLQQSGNQLFLTVEDDGCGFNISEMNDLKGAGLSNIQARIEMLSGKLAIDSSAQRGSTFTLECSID